MHQFYHETYYFLLFTLRVKRKFAFYPKGEEQMSRPAGLSTKKAAISGGYD